jgi:molybdopterin synthase sulfur carrier subunit
VTPTVLVDLPASLSQLAGCARRLALAVPGEVTQRGILDALELRHPMLRGTIRDQASKARRPFIRFFACETDLSHDPPDTQVPAAVAAGTEPFQIVAAIAGG